MATRKMRLFVWENVLTDYAPGMVVALAPNLDVALDLAESRSVREAMLTEPSSVIDVRADTEPQVWVVYGGG